MTKQYTAYTWSDEVLIGPARYDINTDEGEPINEDVAIALVTAVAQAGSSFTAARMNNIEAGVDMLDTIVNQDGVRLLQVDGESDPVTLELASVQDGQVLMRAGTDVIGADLPSPGISMGKAIAAAMVFGG